MFVKSNVAQFKHQTQLSLNNSATEVKLGTNRNDSFTFLPYSPAPELKSSISLEKLPFLHSLPSEKYMFVK